MLSRWLLICLSTCVTFNFAYSQTVGNIVLINSQNTSNLNICYSEKTIKVFFENPSPFTLKNVLVNVSMPSGVEYVTGSISGGAEQNISIQNSPIFAIDSIESSSFDTLVFNVISTCASLPFLDSGGVAANTIRVDYTANSLNFYDIKTIAPYNIEAPNLSITQITNQTYAGSVGDNYQRCISIVNGGTGALKSFTLEETHGTGIGVNNVSLGNWTSVSGVETILLNGSHFTTIGDGDSLFESGETIIICEDITLINCFDNLSEYIAFWGCNGNSCQNSFETANAFFPGLVPNISTSSTSSSDICFDAANRQSITIKNNGPGNATNILVDMYQVNNSVYSDIDVSSIFYIDAIGDTINVIPDSTYNKRSAAYSCSSNPKSGFKYVIPSLLNGDSIVLQWDVYNCCKTVCGNKNYNGWYYEISYKNDCGGYYSNGRKIGRSYGYTRGNFSDNGNPGSLIDGDAGSLSFYVNDFRVGRMGANNSGFFKVVFKKSPCMVFTGNLKFVNAAGTSTWNANSTYQTADSIVAIFNAPIPVSFNRGELSFDYIINCSGCSGGTSSISLDIYYTPDTVCGCELHLTCTSFPPINIFCPDGGCEGFLIKKYSFERFNFGNPDYNEDGLPDNNTSAHKDSVEKHKIIYGDTVISVVSGIVLSDTTWDYLYGVSNIANKAYLTLLSADVDIIDTGGNIYSYNNIPYTINSLSATVEEYNFDFTVDTLSKYGNLPSNFKYKGRDSVVLTLKYFANNNTSGQLRNVSNTMRIYLSDTVNPVRDTNKFDCYEPLGNITSVNHYITLSGGTDYKIKTCQNLLLSMNYYFSVGPCCSNYAGGNVFKGEYRHFSVLETMGLKIPSGYNILYSRMRESRTRGTGGRVTSPYKYITPISNVNDSLTFRLDTVLYTTNGGTAYPSDEGYYGTLQVMLEPTCAALSDSITRVPYWSQHTQNFNGIPANPIRNYTRTTVQFTAPNLQFQSINPSLVAPNNTVTWTLLIDNLSNLSYAPDFWFRKSNNSGVNILSIFDIKNNRFLTPNSFGLYLADTIQTSENRRFEITANFTSCNQDSMLVDMGWSCNGFPSSIATIECDPLQINLSVTPLLGALETKIISQSDTIGLCDTAEFMYEATSIQRGTVYELEFSTILPQGLSIVPGSSFLSLFDTLSFINVSDPINVSGSKWKWSLYTSSQGLDTNGLKGVLNSLINKCYLKFKAITTCGFASGNTFKSEFLGKSSCGLPTNIASVGTNPLYISNSLPKYTSTIDIRTTYLTPCLNNTYVEVLLINNGPDSTYLTDSITIELPSNINFVANSFNGMYNAPNASYAFTSNGFSNFFKWGGVAKTAPGDSTLFSFYIDADPTAVNCNVFAIRVFNESFGSSFCNVTNSYCGISTIITDVSKNVFTYKGYLNILNETGYSEYYNDSSEIGYLNFDIFNSGEEIKSSINTYVNFYFDADNNGVFSASDVWIDIDTIFDSIPSVATYNYSYDLIIPSGNSCNIIAVIDTADNPCTCVPSQALIYLPFTTVLNDTLICANNSFNIGITDSIKGYSYSWTPALYLNDPTSSYPLFSYPFNPTNDTLTYILEIDRVNCFHYDTMQIIINGNPLSDAGIDQYLCDTFNTTLIGNVPLNNGDAFWRFLSGTTIPTFSNLNNDTLNVTGLVEGSYFIERLATNGLCDTVRDTIVINTYNKPISNAGLDDSLCNTYSYVLNGNQPLGTSYGEWVFISGLSTPIINDSSLYNTSITNLIEGVYSLSWKVSNGNCPPVYDTVLISVFDAPISNAGLDQNLCDITNTNLQGNQPVGTSYGEWAFISGPSTPIINDSSLYNTSITNLIEGVYFLSWNVSNGNCPPVYDTVLINVFYSPTSNAGLDQDLCNIYTTTLNGNIPQGTSSGKWNLNSSPSTPIINDSSLYNTTLSGLTEGIYSFSWVVINGTCDTAIDTVLVNIYDQPISNAGPNQYLCDEYTTVLAGNIPLGTAKGVWNLINGPNTPTITNDSINNTSISNLIQGEYLFTWTISNGNCPPSVDTVLISVSDLPISNAGLNQVLCSQYITALNGNIPPAGAIGTWHLVNGPNSVTFSDTNLYNTSISNLIEGEYTLIWSVKNGNCPPVIDTVIINIYDSPVSNAGIDINLCDNYVTNLASNNPAGTSSGLWAILNGPNSPIIDSVTRYNTLISGLTEGVYELEWTVSNGVCPVVKDSILINIYDIPKSIVGNNLELCEENLAQITANVNAGTSTGVWNLINAPNIPNIVNPNSSTTSVVNLIEGVYEIEWVVSNGICPAARDTLIISNNPKPNVSFVANLIGVCEQECIDFTNTSTITNPDTNTSYYWNFGDGQFSANENPTVCFNNNGEYNVSLKVTSNNNCLDSLTNTNYITIYPIPQAYFSITPSSDITNYQMIRVNDGSINGDFYYYDFGNGTNTTDKNPSFFYADTGNYIIVQAIESQFGCKDTFQREVIVKQEVLVYVPNTFTPDGDNTNEVYTPSVIGADENNYEFMVFNRWGDLIFQTNKMNVGWDGTFKNVMSKTDTYVWRIKCQSKKSGEKFNFTGHVNLLK